MVKASKAGGSQSGKCKVAFFEVHDWEEAMLKSDLECCERVYFSEPLAAENAKSIMDFEIVSVFIYSKISRRVLGMLPRLKMIATRSTGFDHIDMKECRRRGIVVCNVPSYGENTVAEHAFALILSLSRRIHESYERTVRADFNNDGLQGFDLRGKTLGVAGTGHIGQHVIRIARGFEMDVIAYDKFPNAKLASELGFSYVSFSELLAKSDILTLHMPYSRQTHHTINKKNVFRMKKGAILINTARGPLVETEALTDALVKNHLGGAGLDVLEEEDVIKEENELLSRKFSNEELKTLLRNHVLLKLDNVIITPHNAFNSREAIQRILSTSLENIRQYCSGNVQNAVPVPKA